MPSEKGRAMWLLEVVLKQRQDHVAVSQHTTHRTQLWDVLFVSQNCEATKLTGPVISIR